MKRKIKKPARPVKEVIAELPLGIKIGFFIPVIALIAVLLWAFLWSPQAQTNQNHANRELLLNTAGKWETFEDWGMDIWVPKDIPQEEMDEEHAATEVRYVTRDKGKFPEISFGVIVAPEVDGVTFNLELDPAGVMDITTPLLNDALGRMINGAYPTMTTDVISLTLPSGEYALQAQGEMAVVCVFQDPKNPSEPYQEEVTQNIYYNIVLFHGRPVVVWGTWDYSTYEGEKRTMEAVNDAVTSIMRSDGGDVIEPIEDFGIQDEAPSNYIEQPEVESGAYWDEEQQVWIDDVTGEVRDDLPHIDDPYWDDKQYVPEEEDTELEILDPNAPIESEVPVLPEATDAPEDTGTE